MSSGVLLLVVLSWLCAQIAVAQTANISTDVKSCSLDVQWVRIRGAPLVHAINIYSIGV